MADEKREGVSIREIEEFAKQHRSKLLFTALFVLSALFGVLGSFGSGWCVVLGMGGAILGFLVPLPTMNVIKKTFQFVIRQETPARFILCAILVLLAGFVPFTLFLLVGMLGGVTIHQLVNSP